VPARGAPRDEAAIDIVPQRQARAARKGFEFPPGIAVLQHLGASARVTRVSIGLGAPVQVSFTVPTVPTLPSTVKGAHSRRCAGSVSACQTFSSDWRKFSDENERPLLSVLFHLRPVSRARCVQLAITHRAADLRASWTS